MAFKDKKKGLEYIKQWRAENVEKVRGYANGWRARNLEKANASSRAYRKQHSTDKEYLQRQSEIAKRSNEKFKRLCFAHYGNACACCGEHRQEFLSIDHAEGGGTKFRQQHPGMAGVRMYRWLVRHN